MPWALAHLLFPSIMMAMCLGFCVLESGIIVNVSALHLRYLDMGIRAFILSGYPHLEEGENVARWILPRIPQCRLARVQGRLPESPPSTPLTDGPRR